MNVFTEEFKTAAAKCVAYSLVALPLILLLLLAGGIERGLIL